MADFNSTITLSQSEYRPCVVDNRNALFHTWEIKKEIIPPSPYISGHNGGAVQATLGIVEFEDGHVGEVYPHKIKFADNKISEYCFRNENEDS